jgi:hypothetical protein
MTKNRHELPRKKPARNAKDEIAEDLPTLEPVADELPTLEAVADDLPILEAAADEAAAAGPVHVAALGGEGGFDVVLQVDVADMDKKAVADAVKAPFAAACQRAAATLRHRKVLVRFGGEALIGSAVKELVAAALAPHKPLLAVVQRGMGDETVAQGKLPEVDCMASERDGVVLAEVATGEIEAADLAVALRPHLAAVQASAGGKRVRFVFTGKARPDAALRGELAAALQAAGALAAAIGERVLFDKDLSGRVRVAASGERTTIDVQCAADDETTLEALELALPEHVALCREKVVRFDLSAPAPAPRARCLEWAREHGAARVDFGDEVAWPPLVALVAGAEPTLRLQPNGRTRAQTLAALVAEAPAYAAACAGKPMVLDWPAGFALDVDAGKALCELTGALAPRTLACTFGGELREPFVPDPCAFGLADGTTTLTLDSEAGKPAELQRAIDRRLPGKVKDLRGKAVRVQVGGAAALSRTLLRGVCSALEQAGVARLELADGDAIDVLAPPLLAIEKRPDGVHVAARVEGRDAAQVQRAIGRELEAAGVGAGAAVFVGASPAADAIVAAVLAKGAARVVLAGPPPVQVHPPLLGAAEKKGAAVRFSVTPAGDAAWQGRMLDRELPKFAAALPALAGVTATIAWPGGDPASPHVARLAEACIGKQAAKVLLDASSGDAVQLHPKPAAALASAPDHEAAVATAPAGAAGAVADAAAAGAAPSPPTLQLLGRRDDVAPPLVVVGVPAGADPAHLAAVEVELRQHLPRFQGRAVLLVLRADGRDVPVRTVDPLVDLLRRTVPTTAAATLVFRGPDAAGRAHFETVHSRLPALPTGATFADPRSRR